MIMRNVNKFEKRGLNGPIERDCCENRPMRLMEELYFSKFEMVKEFYSPTYFFSLAKRLNKKYAFYVRLFKNGSYQSEERKIINIPGKAGGIS